MQSETIGALAKALAKAQGEFSAIPKTDANPFFKSKYAGLPSVVAAASPILTKNGLSISQHVGVDEHGFDVLTTYLIHESGEYLANSARLNPVKNDPQGLGSAITYMRRYAYMAALGLVADGDDDGQAASSSAKIATKPDPKRMSAKTKGVIMEAATDLGLEGEALKAKIEQIVGEPVGAFADLTEKQGIAIVAALGAERSAA